MSDTTETENADEATTEDPQDFEFDDETLAALTQALAAAQYEDAFRPPSGGAAADTDAAEVPDDEGDEQPDNEGDEGNPNHEAAKWRTKFRDTQARLEAMQRAAVDSYVTTMGMKPAALWASGAQLADLLADDGTPETAKVAAAAEAAKESLGVQVYTKPRAGLQSGAMAHQPKRDRWVEAFGPRE